MTENRRVTVTNEPRPTQEWRFPFDVFQITGTATGSAQTLVTVPDDTLIEIKHMLGENSSGGAITVTFHIVPDGGTIGATNEFESVSVAANGPETFEPLKGALLLPGDSLQVFASSANAVNIRGWGMAYR